MPSQPITVSYSELAAMRQCPLRHALEYKHRWTHDPAPGTPLSRGTLWHQVLRTHYESLRKSAKMGLGPTERLKMAQDAVIPLLHQQGAMTEDQELIAWMYEGYRTHYQVDPGWQVLAIEYKTEVPLLDEAGAQTRFKLKVYLDLVVRETTTHQIWVIDHKSGQNLPSDSDLDLDDQFGLYVWALRQIGKKIRGSIHSAARTQKLKTKPQPLPERFHRTPLYRTDQELTNIALDAYRCARAAYSKVNAIPYSSPDPKTCGWKCDLKEPHLAARKGMPINQILKDFGFYQLEESRRRVGMEE